MTLILTFLILRNLFWEKRSCSELIGCRNIVNCGSSNPNSPSNPNLNSKPTNNSIRIGYPLFDLLLNLNCSIQSLLRPENTKSYRILIKYLRIRYIIKILNQKWNNTLSRILTSWRIRISRNTKPNIKQFVLIKLICNRIMMNGALTSTKVKGIISLSIKQRTQPRGVHEIIITSILTRNRLFISNYRNRFDNLRRRINLQFQFFDITRLIRDQLS